MHIWKILTFKESLWVKWIHSYRLERRNFWEVEIKANTSWGWRKLLQLREEVRWHFVSKIGNGQRTSSWFDTWFEIGQVINWISRRGYSKSRF